MNIKDIKITLTKYRIRQFTITMGKNTHEVETTLVSTIALNCNFDKEFMPFFQVTISVPNKIYRLMQTNYDNLKAKLQIQGARFSDAVTLSTEKTNTWKNIINNTFAICMEDVSPDLKEKEQKTYENSDNQYGDFVTVNMLLYPYDYYKKFDLVVNDVLVNTKILDGVIYCLNKCGITKYLISPVYNVKKYSQLIITPIPLKRQLERLCNNYALHKKGTVVYFGYDRLYLIDKEAKCTAYEPDEYKITYIIYDSESASTSQAGGCFMHTSNKYSVINATEMLSPNNDMVVEKSIGNNIVAVNSSGTISKIGTSNVTNVIVQEEGEDKSQQISQSILESKKTLTVGFRDININMITPNKQMVVSVSGTASTVKKFNGKYRISGYNTIFEKEGDYFSVNGSMILKGE